MIRIFTGDDRVRAGQEITKLLGDDYEVIEGTDLKPEDLPSIFKGASLFTTTRHILIRDLGANKPVFEQLPHYLDTPHDIIIQELKLDKRSTAYKQIKDQIEIRDFALPQNPNFRLVFDIYKTAKTNGPESIKLLDRVKQDEDPIMFFGLLASQALKDFSQKQGIKERKTIKELAKLDQELKSSPIDPWLLIESFLLRLSSLQK